MAYDFMHEYNNLIHVWFVDDENIVWSIKDTTHFFSTDKSNNVQTLHPQQIDHGQNRLSI